MLHVAEYGLDVAMYWCRRMHYGECQEVRVLHASTYLHGTWPEIQKILEYMNGEGFVVEHKQYASRRFCLEWMSADVLLLGCDSKEWRRIIEALTEMERGLLGVWRGWDILWYFADDRVPRAVRMHMGGSGLATNDRCSAEGIRMIRAHIRRRFDVVARRGLFVTLEQWIADSIDRLVPARQDYDTFGRKVDRLKSKMKGVEGDRDWDLFVAATELLMEARNRSSHPRVTSSFNQRNMAYDEFKKVARTYGFEIPHIAHGCPSNTDSQDRQAYMKMLVAMARMAKTWLDECDTSLWK